MRHTTNAGEAGHVARLFHFRAPQLARGALFRVARYNHPTRFSFRGIIFEIIGEPTFADAILDRIVHNAYRLALDGPSMRKIQAAELEAAVPVVDTTSSTSATTAKGAKK